MPFSPGFFNLLIHRLKENKMNQFESRKETYALFTRFLQEALGLGPDSIQLADIHRMRSAYHLQEWKTNYQTNNQII